MADKRNQKMIKIKTPYSGNIVLNIQGLEPLSPPNRQGHFQEDCEEANLEPTKFVELIGSVRKLPAVIIKKAQQPRIVGAAL